MSRVRRFGRRLSVYCVVVVYIPLLLRQYDNNRMGLINKSSTNIQTGDRTLGEIIQSQGGTSNNYGKESAVGNNYEILE